MDPNYTSPLTGYTVQHQQQTPQSVPVLPPGFVQSNYTQLAQLPTTPFHVTPQTPVFTVPYTDPVLSQMPSVANAEDHFSEHPPGVPVSTFTAGGNFDSNALVGQFFPLATDGLPVFTMGVVGGNEVGRRNCTRQTGQQAEKGALHSEILEFSKRCLLTDEEAGAMDSLLRDLDKKIRRMFPATEKVVLYGSQATGLALPCSDLDIVILGVGTQIFAPAEQFTEKEKRRMVDKLHHLSKHLQKNGYVRKGDDCTVVEARVPIMKAEINRSGYTFKTDISMGVRNAADAIGLICEHVAGNPAVRPLVLVIKAVLKQAGLNEVYRGGISSYVLFNLVVAHLMLEGCVTREAGRNLAEQKTMKGRLRVLTDSIGQCDLDLGQLLLSFFHRFADWRFGRSSDAVSIARGGLCSKSCVESGANGVLCVEDPQATGKNAASGSFKMRNVLNEFAAAARKLEDGIMRIATGQNHYKGSSFPILNSLIDCESIIARQPIMSKNATPKPPRKKHVKRQREECGTSHRTRDHCRTPTREFDTDSYDRSRRRRRDTDAGVFSARW